MSEVVTMGQIPWVWLEDEGLKDWPRSRVA